MTTSTPPAGAGVDPSMEDILASIRRILSEDETEATPPAPASAGPAAPARPEVLALDASMLVEDTPAAPLPLAVPVMAEPPKLSAAEPKPAEPKPADPPAAEPHAAEPPADAGPLLGAAAAAAASSSVGSLLRTLAGERQQVAVYRGGPTLEDMAREELRPLLKQWLDSNLPPLVERLVRAEIERVVGRALS